jgi:hypothetical protein
MSVTPTNGVLVIGAAGRTGLRICRLLALRKVPFRALVRRRAALESALSAAGVEAPGMEVVEGDVDDARAVDAAMAPLAGGARVSAVVYAAGSKPTRDEAIPRAVDRDGVAVSVAAALKHGARRYVLISSAKTDEPWSPVALILNIMVPFVMQVRCAGLPCLAANARAPCVRALPVQVRRRAAAAQVGAGLHRGAPDGSHRRIARAAHHR